MLKKNNACSFHLHKGDVKKLDFLHKKTGISRREILSLSLLIFDKYIKNNKINYNFFENYK